MGEVIQFISKAERERIRLIREARAMYDSVFPPSDSDNVQGDNTPIVHSVNGAKVHHGGDILGVINNVAALDNLSTFRN